MQAKIDAERLYPPAEAMRLVTQTATVKFDATVNLALRLGIDPRRADQMVRGSVALPHGTGKSMRVAVFAEGAKAAEAEAAGADIVKAAGDRTHRGRQPRFRRRHRDARPDGQDRPLRQGAGSPRPHAQPEQAPSRWTSRAVSRDQGRKDQLRSDRQTNVHLVLGKASFDARQLTENYGAVLDELLRVAGGLLQRALPAQHPRCAAMSPGPHRPDPHA